MATRISIRPNAAVGHVDMERFIVLVNREPRDYTKWRESQFNDDDETIYELADKKKYTPPRRLAQAANEA